MKLRLSILLLAAAALAAAPAAGQTIKSLGFNTTNGVVPTTALSNLPLTFTNTGGISCSSFDSGNVLIGSNTITFYGTNSGLAFSAGANASQVRNQIGLGATWLTNTDVTNFRTAIGLGTTNTVAFDTIQIQSDIFTPALEASDGTNYVVLTASEISFQGVAGPQTRTNLGLGATNNVTFSNITANGIVNAKSATSGTPTNATNARGIQWSGLSSEHAAIYGTYDGVAKIGLSVGTSNSLSDVASFRATGMTVSSNAIVGGTLAVSNTATFATNVSVAGSLTATGNATLNGSDNLMPNATTASSASSLMTRDLVGQEFANPRTKMQTTYWFGLEGVGAWTTTGTAASTSYSASGNATGFYGGINIGTTTRIGLNVNGAALRLNASGDGEGNYTVSTAGALTLRARLRKHGATGSENAAAFIMGFRNGTSIWQEGAYGLYSVSQPTNVWTSNAVVAQHDRISVSNVVWAVNTAGTNGATEPTWTDLIGSLVTNGSAVYVNAGPHTSNNWVLAIGSTNASAVVMTNTGKQGFVTGLRSQVVLKLRTLGTTNSPYPIFATVENSAGESTEVSLTTTNASSRQPQFWSRYDALNNGGPDPALIYFSVDGQLGPL